MNFPQKKKTPHPSRIVGVQTYFRYPSDIIRWNLTLLVAKGNLHLPTEFALEKTTSLVFLLVPLYISTQDSHPLKTSICLFDAWKKKKTSPNGGLM